MSSPTTRASNIWPVEGGDDILQISGRGGAVLGGITAGGAGFGALAGGGVPGGATTQLQYNNAGVFGGIGSATFDGASTLIFSDPNLQFEVLSGPTQSNGFVISSTGVEIVGGEAGSFLQLEADSTVSITSDNSDVTFNADNGNISFAASRITFASTSATGIKIGGSSTDHIGFYGGIAIVKPTVTGSKGGNAALTSLMTALANLGLITDSTT